MQNKNLARKAVHKASTGQQLTFNEAVQYLYEGLPVSTAEVFRGGAGLIRAKHFYSMIGTPQEQYKTIHIAGTSGKGSVAHIVTHLLTAHDFMTGTFTSPHAYDIRERVLLNGEMVSRAEFARVTTDAVSYILRMQQNRHGPATFFEVMTGIAYRAFADHKIDYAVIETGLGGLYDSTNVIDRSDKLAVITALGFDHTEILGKTLPEIATQKAGIMPQHGQSVAWEPDDPDTRAVLQSTASDRQTKLQFATPDLYTLKSTGEKGVVFDYHSETLTIKNIHLSLYGEHQAQNAALALQSLEILAARDGFTIQPDAVRSALTNVFIPARFERVVQDDRQLIFDGAHNPQKMQAFVDALKSSGIQKANWVLALKHSKDVRGTLEIIKPYVDTLYATVFLNSHKDMAIFHAISAEDLAKLALEVGIRNVEIIPDCRDALDTAYRSTGSTPIVISGSFYLVGDLRPQVLTSLV